MPASDAGAPGPSGAPASLRDAEPWGGAVLDIQVESRDASARDFERLLTAIDGRIEALSRAASLSGRDFAELTALYNNAGYILLYLGSNSAHIRVDGLRRHRDALRRPGARNRRLGALVAALDLDDPDFQAARAAFLAHFAEGDGAERTAEDAALARFREAAQRWRRGVDDARSDLLARLGVRSGDGRPDAAFFALMSRTEAPDLRCKLATAWRGLDEQGLEHQIAAIDALIEARRRCSRAEGFSSVAGRTLACGALGLDQIAAFLDRSIERARLEHEQLERDLAGRYGTGGVDAHFPRRIADVRAGRPAPSIALQPCIDFAFEIARRQFGLEARRVEDCPAHMISYDLRRGGARAGRINFDLWGAMSGRTVNATLALRSAADWGGVRQQPVAHISCRFRERAGRAATINFQNAHSLLHEFGHALNHILVRPRLPNLSGLEHLPLERLEILSMWFERWVFHPEFERHLNQAGGAPSGLAVCREIKRLEYVRTHLERSLLAALDFAVHTSDEGGVVEAYRAFDRRFGVAGACPLGDLLASFSRPILTERPGGYFSYLWAAARSAELFEPLRALTLEDAPGPADTMRTLRECFECDAPSRAPDIDALYRFYRPGPGSAGRRGAP